MTTFIPKLLLLELRFKAIKPILKLPHYHGPQWSALLRETLKPYLSEAIFQSGIWIHTVETGVLSYEKNDIICLGLIVPIDYSKALPEVFKTFNRLGRGRGFFQPGNTIELESIYCRISRRLWDENYLAYLSQEALQDEIEGLCAMDQFSALLTSPLRLTRPEGAKESGHRYCDEGFFLNPDIKDRPPMRRFIDKIRLPAEPLSADDVAATQLKVVNGALTWLDIPYGDTIKKTIGGAVGKLVIQGRPTRLEAERLVLGQYIGLGKNAAFGLGFYQIPELDKVRKIANLARGVTLLKRSISVSTLRESLYQLPDASPGPDGVTLSDVKKAGNRCLEILAEQVIKGTAQHGGIKKYITPKRDGAYREISVLNVTDKLIHKAFANGLTPIVDALLSNSSYAYRRGLNRQGAVSAFKKALSEGYQYGVKADISAFFESINLETLCFLIEGLFPNEPMAHRLIHILTSLRDAGVKGIAQGSPLSPLLSNLYLDRFDKDMETHGLRLIRYADDFIALTQDDSQGDNIMEKIKTSLARLQLSLKKESVEEVHQQSSIRFLGYIVTSSSVENAPKEPIVEEQWDPVFKENWIEGNPLYLTSLCSNARTTGPSIAITVSGVDKTISWNAISKIVIVGRSGFSKGLIYRAVKENIPVTFIDVMGRASGRLYPERYEPPDMVYLQQAHVNDLAYCLAFAKEIVSAKIHNSFMLLKRNKIASSELKAFLNKVNDAENLESLRGYEGAAAKLYFTEFAKLTAPFPFHGRTYHPPEGPVNSMLSFGYTLIYHRLASVLKDQGFNPRVGFFHQGRGSHAALASDMMEELRHIVERIVLALIHLKEIKEGDFIMSDKKGVSYTRLKGEGFRTFIHRFETTMAKEFTHYENEKLSYNQYLDEMARKLKRSLKLNLQYTALRID